MGHVYVVPNKADETKCFRRATAIIKINPYLLLFYLFFIIVWIFVDILGRIFLRQFVTYSNMCCCVPAIPVYNCIRGSHKS